MSLNHNYLVQRTWSATSMSIFMNFWRKSVCFEFTRDWKRFHVKILSGKKSNLPSFPQLKLQLFQARTQKMPALFKWTSLMASCLIFSMIKKMPSRVSTLQGQVRVSRPQEPSPRSDFLWRINGFFRIAIGEMRPKVLGSCFEILQHLPLPQLVLTQKIFMNGSSEKKADAILQLLDTWTYVAWRQGGTKGWMTTF